MARGHDEIRRCILMLCLLRWTTAAVVQKTSCPSPLPCYCDKSPDGANGTVDCSGRPLGKVPKFLVLTGLPFARVLLGNSGIGALRKHDFKGLNVTDIDLSHNRIGLVSDRAFDDVIGVTSLRMRNCSLDSVPRALGALRRLRLLDLAGNAIRHIATEALAALVYLETLDLSHNPLQLPASSESMANLGRLGTLNLSSCGLRQVPTATLQPLSRLTVLDLSDNALTLASGAFRGLERLEVLTLRGCNVPRLTAAMFQDLPALQRLAVVSCNVSHVASSTFDAMSRLAHLHLDNNNITRLYFLSTNPCHLDQTNVTLDHNPIYCDCDVHSLVQKKIMAISGTCGAPYAYRRLLLAPPVGTEPGQRHLEESSLKTCSTRSRVTERYDCGCETWLGLGEPRTCMLRSGSWRLYADVTSHVTIGVVLVGQLLR
ncbi:hypothetical protein NP493_10g02031 [Ridgeia piscesae]|uniref:Uncharacterized protein n=1 Tax=Ridgeia piscesae TaxID=27915 RepID=A0AAD9PEU7_RIDPI|nr:hypothetical protein NP493_10g02031 [Ridgeia piscesae]